MKTAFAKGIMLQDGKKIRDQMYLYLKDTYEGAILPSLSIQQILDGAYSFKEAEKQFKQLQEYIKLDEKMRILDAGCGFGHFVSCLLAKGYNCFGYEVDPRLAEIAKKLLTKNRQNSKRIKLITSNQFPYKDDSFDLINLHLVLDYVSDIPSLMEELKRILKSKGQIFIIVPNYQCFYYPIPALVFIPWLPKFLNRVYFRLMGRPNTNFLESLTFTTPRYLEKVFKNLSFEISSLGFDSWKETVTGRKSLNDRGSLLKSMIKFVRKLHLSWLLNLVGKMGFYTPLVYVLEKEK